MPRSSVTVPELVTAVSVFGRFAARNAVGTGGWSEEELEQMMPKIAAPQPPQLISESAETVVRLPRKTVMAVRRLDGSMSWPVSTVTQCSYMFVVLSTL